MALQENPPPEALNQFEMILDRIERAVDKVDKEDIIRVLKVIIKLVRIAFRFVPMSGDQKALLKEIVGAIEDAIKAWEGE